MKILVIGSGGREHAIGQKLLESRHQPELYFTPGNPGVMEMGQRLDIDINDIQGLKLFAAREKIDLTVVGPEAPLAAGITDVFQEAGLKVFGPCKAGAQMEASKVFAKELMQEAGIPTAKHTFCKDEASALKALNDFEAPYVIKEDGLAGGKGVTIAEDQATAQAAIKRAFAKNMPVVIEECMTGPELSIMALVDGKTALPLLSAQDYKRAYDGNQGPNSGGMGAYAPVPIATPEILETVDRTVLQPTLKAFQARGIGYKGVLYMGLMLTATGPKVVEYNVRFGDPETQVVLPLLDEDLVDLMMAVVEGRLEAYAKTGLRAKKNQHAVTVVLASDGYPGDYKTGYEIRFPQYLSNEVYVFHAGTKLMPDQKIVTNGGRVLNITGTGNSLEQARSRAYEIVSQVSFENKFYRRDIALEPSRALAE